MSPAGDSRESSKNGSDTAAINPPIQSSSVVSKPPPTLNDFISRINAMDAGPDCLDILEAVASKEPCAGPKFPFARIVQFDTESDVSSDANDQTDGDHVDWNVRFQTHLVQKVKYLNDSNKC